LTGQIKKRIPKKTRQFSKAMMSNSLYKHRPTSSPKISHPLNPVSAASLSACHELICYRAVDDAMIEVSDR